MKKLSMSSEIVPSPNKKYRIILADPPWNYGNTKNLNGQFYGIAERHYKTLPIKDIINLPVSKIADENCYLFLWITSPFMKYAFRIIEEWGFKYSTVGFVWIKMTNDMKKIRGDGLGKYTISNAEYCLIGRKGKYWRNEKNVKQIIFAPKQEHSRKPSEIRDRIVQLCGDLPRIELFAREHYNGWDAVGYDINGKNIKQELDKY